MGYEYVKRTYDVNPVVGDRVFHTVIDRAGTICREDRSQGHYVQVKFDGRKHSTPCHPTELKYLGKEPAA